MFRNSGGDAKGCLRIDRNTFTEGLKFRMRRILSTFNAQIYYKCLGRSGDWWSASHRMMEHFEPIKSFAVGAYFRPQHALPTHNAYFKYRNLLVLTWRDGLRAPIK